ncbi:hypothetical protein CK215_20250 [Mesorhizobium sp. WSM3864]|nr:hypothetical protein CK215_20250 [Mesorhizobium sp. WSM3864]
MGEAQISPLEGEMSPKATEGVLSGGRIPFERQWALALHARRPSPPQGGRFELRRFREPTP